MLDPISKLFGMPEYYLDTNAVRKLAPMLSEGVHDSLLTSVYTLVELIGNIKDESSFVRQKAILEKIAKGRFKIDQYLPEDILFEAFNIPVQGQVSDQIFDLMLRIITLDNFEDWKAHEEAVMPHPNIYEYVQAVDNNSTFKEHLKKQHTDEPYKERINEFNEIWDESKSRDEILTRVVEYYIQKRKAAFPAYADRIRYNSSINLFMLVHAHYVGKKVTYHDNPGRNDFQDLMHLLYVRQGMTLVTDDRHFRNYVNEVWSDRAITTDDLLKIYKK